MNRRPWAPWELQFLRQEYGGSVTRDIARVLNRGVGSVHQRAGMLGLKKNEGFAAETSRRLTLSRSPFTPEIAEVIELLYPDTVTQEIADLIGMPLERVHAYANHQGWKKTPEFVRDTARLRAGPDHPMRAYQFPKGHVPANKGVKGQPAVGRARETLFKKGQMPPTWKPIGTYRINADGYLDQKVTDTGYPPRDWQAVHRLKWIEKNGPVPAGHVLRFKPGMRTTDPELITPDSVECISLAENGRRNAWHANMPPDLRKLMGSRIALSRMINKRQRALTEETSCQMKSKN